MFGMSVFETISAVGIMLAGCSNLMFAFYLRSFVKQAIPSIKNIERATRVMKTDTLLKRRQEAIRRLKEQKESRV